MTLPREISNSRTFDFAGKNTLESAVVIRARSCKHGAKKHFQIAFPVKLLEKSFGVSQKANLEHGKNAAFLFICKQRFFCLSKRSGENYTWK